MQQLTQIISPIYDCIMLKRRQPEAAGRQLVECFGCGIMRKTRHGNETKECRERKNIIQLRQWSLGMLQLLHTPLPLMGVKYALQ